MALIFLPLGMVVKIIMWEIFKLMLILAMELAK